MRLGALDVVLHRGGVAWRAVVEQQARTQVQHQRMRVAVVPRLRHARPRRQRLRIPVDQRIEQREQCDLVVAGETSCRIQVRRIGWERHAQHAAAHGCRCCLRRARTAEQHSACGQLHQATSTKLQIIRPLHVVSSQCGYPAMPVTVPAKWQATQWLGSISRHSGSLPAHSACA